MNAGVPERSIEHRLYFNHRSDIVLLFEGLEFRFFCFVLLCKRCYHLLNLKDYQRY